MIPYLIIVLISGLLTPIQTAVNSRLRASVGYVYLSTLVSFTVSTLALVAVGLIIGTPILPSSRQIGEASWWMWGGGIIALGTISVNILLFKAIGQLQAMVLPIFGQLVFSLVIDHFGLFGSRAIPISGFRFLGMCVVIAGVFLITVLPNFGKWRNGNDGAPAQVLWQLLGVADGILMASISAVYARLGLVLGSALQATTVSFIIATAVMLLICVPTGKISCIGKAFRRDCPWWMWTGGILGATSVFINSFSIPVIGVGLFSITLLLGQMSQSLGMEHYGWFGAPRKRVRAIQLLGIVLMLGGVILTRWQALTN